MQTVHQISHWLCQLIMGLQPIKHTSKHRTDHTKQSPSHHHRLHINCTHWASTVLAKMLKTKDHMDTRGVQFIAAASANPNHPCHHMSNHPQTHRHINTRPQRHHNDIVQNIPPPINNNYKTHIHTHITINAINNQDTNSILAMKPPPIEDAEKLLHRSDRVHLSCLCCGHQPQLLQDKHRRNDTTDITCHLCQAAPHLWKTVWSWFHEGKSTTSYMWGMSGSLLGDRSSISVPWACLIRTDWD